MANGDFYKAKEEFLEKQLNGKKYDMEEGRLRPKDYSEKRTNHKEKVKTLKLGMENEEMMCEELLKSEKKSFVEEMKIKKNSSLAVKEDYYQLLEKALDDAFRQYAQRENRKYVDKKRAFLEEVVNRLYKYLNDVEDTFEKCFELCIEMAKTFLDNGSYGIAQKFVNMSFKYLYCCSDVEGYERKFQECHMPLDKYTIKWIRKLGDKEINEKLNKINNAWSRIDDTLYNEIQDLVTRKLKAGYKYTISFNDKLSNEEKECILPNHRLCAEFIIWHQEKIIELYNKIIKAEQDWNRLGIEKIK